MRSGLADVAIAYGDQTEVMVNREGGDYLSSSPSWSLPFRDAINASSVVCDVISISMTISVLPVELAT